MSGRPREFDEAGVLAGAMGVFWARGFEGASLRDLTAATGLGKGSLYGAFGDKRRLYLRALAFYLDGLIAHVATALGGSSGSPERMRAFLESAADRAAAGDRRGCFLCGAATDVVAADPDVAALVADGIARLESAIRDGLSYIEPGARQARARQILAVYVGAQSLARAGYAPASIRDAIAQTLQTLH